MCGITGYWASGGNPEKCVVASMANRIASRGPDDAGAWVDGEAGLALAHRRLSIIDLSAAGHQPMVSPCGRYVLVFNGEIYNHEELRSDLEREGGHFDWRGHSDTETLLAAVRHWGVEFALTQLNGMFAFALWDRTERKLFLARDRMGEKPLYYGRCGDTFLFGSELKALTAHPDFNSEVNRDALALYFRHNCVPAPYSIYRDVFKLSPAHFLVVSECGRVIGEPQCYWDLGAISEQQSAVEGVDSVELEESLDSLLRDAVKRRMAADVPLGAFLSGGYDSSVITALMQAQSNRPVKTFSIGFNEAGYNEAEHAKAVAAYLGTDHTELYVTPSQAMCVVPRLPEIYDEPFSDSSQIPTFLVSQLARQSVTVSLSGDGGDELFAGYNRHIVGPAIWNKVGPMPSFLRGALGMIIRLLGRADIDTLSRYLPERMQLPGLGNKLDKLGAALNASDGLAFYKSLASHWQHPSTLVLGGAEPETVLDRREDIPQLPNLREQMLYLDMMTYLPDDILTKVDRASMAVSLEARVPLLDHRVVEFAWRVPSEFKYRNGQGKWLLRQVLYRYLPREMMDRPKMGFSVPIGAWLRGPLKEWADDLLNEKRLRDQGYLNAALIRRMWHEHASGKRQWHYHLWDVLMFQAWLAEQKHGRSQVASLPQAVAV